MILLHSKNNYYYVCLVLVCSSTTNVISKISVLVQPSTALKTYEKIGISERSPLIVGKSTDHYAPHPKTMYPILVQRIRGTGPSRRSPGTPGGPASGRRGPAARSSRTCSRTARSRRTRRKSAFFLCTCDSW